MATDFVRLMLLGLAALGIGLSINALRKHPLSLAYHSPEQRLRDGLGRLDSQETAPAIAVVPRMISLEEFQAGVSGRKGFIIDARAAAFYRLGHVPGALNLPRETFADDYSKQSALPEAHKEAEITVYCSEADCPDSEIVARALARLGFRHLAIYKEGWEEWTQAGLPQERAPAP